MKMTYKARFTKKQKREFVEKAHREYQQLQADMLNKTSTLTKDPEKTLQYLEFLAQFHKYSPRNRAMILSQRQSAIGVGSYKWFQSQGYQVQRGEKGIKIMAPATVTLFSRQKNGTSQLVKLSEATANEKKQIAAGKIKTRSKTVYRLGTVFDVTQTNMPKDKYPEYYPNRHVDFEIKDKQQAQELKEALQAVGKELQVKLITKEKFDKLAPQEQDAIREKLGNAKGAFFPAANTIMMNPKNTPSEDITVLIHELAHATLHNASPNKEAKEWLAKNGLEKINADQPVAIKELQAEMTSYLVAKKHGIDTSATAQTYIGSWTQNNQKLSEMKPIEQQDILNSVINTAVAFDNVVMQHHQQKKELKQKKEPTKELKQETGRTQSKERTRGRR